MHSFPHIPDYDLYRYLGGGPLTEVYSAWDAEQNRHCAVKVLREEWQDDATAVKLLQREARAGLRARHRHLVTVTDAHVLAPPYFIVMPFLAGESLRRRMQRELDPPLRESLWIARQTAEALASLHQAGFLHGDVKPDNVQIVDDGTAILLDLGFAHRPGENSSFLRKGYILGTPDYLAPELCSSEPEGGFASDIFSFGVMLFEMLTGSMPYPPGSLTQTFRRHDCDPPADIRRILPAIPPTLSRFLDRLLARRPEHRPKAPFVVNQLIALEIGSLSRRAC